MPNLFLKKSGILFMSIIFVLAIGCSVPVTKVAVQSFELEKQIEKERAINLLTNILVDQGYDIKITNKDAEIVTTEYKQYASLGENPPFDYYLKIKVTMRNNNGKLKIKMVPIIKEQNRLNSAAFTEHELAYYTGDPKHVRFIDSMKPETGWRKLAQTNFMNVVSSVAETFGMSVDEVTQNVTKTPANGLSAK